MDTLLQDLRFALRTLRKAPGFTAIAVVCLAIGIAANVTVFSPVNTLLLRPLPFADPERVTSLYMTQLRHGQDEGSWSYPDYRDLGDAGGAFAATGLLTERSWNLGGIDEPERVPGARVTASLFPLLGLRTVVGRGFRPAEEDAGKVVILSHGLWRRRFGGDPSVVGRAVTVNGEPYTVVGVMQPGIRFPETAEMWLPLEPGEAKDHREWRMYGVIGRLKPGVTVAGAQASVAAITRRLAERYPGTNAGWGGWVRPYREEVAGEVRPVMLIMLGAVGFVLLIACANVANLLLARATARQKEVAVRLALGATRRRIIRQFLTESLILAVMGGAAGVLLGAWGLDGIVSMLPADLPYWMVFDVDRTVLLLTLAVTVATGVIFGLAPALQASSLALTETLKDGSRGSTAGARAGRLRSTLVVAEIALSLVLLAGATLMIQSFLRTQSANLGFDSAGALALETSLQGPRYEGDTTPAAAYRALLERVAAAPGVEQAGGVAILPVRSCCTYIGYFPEGKRYPQGEGPTSLYNVVTPGLFGALGMRLLTGRPFDDRDGSGAPRVAVVNRTFAEREWPGRDPIGRRFKIDNPDDSVWVTVVGVVGDVVQRELETEPRAQTYVPHGQNPWRTMTIIVRTSGDPAAIAPAVRREIRAFDKDLPVARVATMAQVVRERMFQPRVYGAMFGIFAAAALLLASVGLYGVMAYSVAQRTHEIGVRMSLGAQPRDVLRLIVRQGARLTVLGLAIGLPVAFGLARLLRGTLYGVSPSDPATFVGISILLTTVAIVASYLPARRAARVDPMEALRSE
jgi:putative ABC transport system permease protein